MEHPQRVAGFAAGMNREKLNGLLELLPRCLRQDRRRLELRLEPWQGRRPASHIQDATLDRLLAQARRSVEAQEWRAAHRPRPSFPSHLPITAHREAIVAAIQEHPVVIIAGETGSGKTTQIPKMCLAAGLGVIGRIGCTQPRRVAALSISRRLAQELHVPWGREVGCKIRFSDRSSPATYIKLMTDGILLAETQGDPDLEEYDVLIIDEAHERSLNIDFLLGHLKTLLGRRHDLKVVITSATIDTKAFSEAFDHAPIFEVSGRLYPVEIRYAPHDPEAEESGDLTYIDVAVQTTGAILGESAKGDILIFMPGERDIRETVEDLKRKHGDRMDVLPLFGRLSAAEQERIFAPTTRRKVIVATNIAETSLTIPGIHYVIDSGLARLSRYNPRTRTKRLPIESISQSSARQRAGRSGRVEDGICIRLYSEEDFAARPPFTQPEIQRANLAEVILRMKAFGLGEIESFPFLNPPAPPAIASGYRLLQELGALDGKRNLTPLGRDLARLPVDPSIGRMVLQSVQENVREEVLIIASGLSIQDPRERPLDRQSEADQAHRRFLDPQSDFVTLLNIWNAFHDTWESLRTQNQLRKFCKAHFLSYLRMREWRDTHAQLRESLREIKWPAQRPVFPRPEGKGATVQAGGRPGSTADIPYGGIHRSILSGLLGHVAQRRGRNLYRSAGHREVMVFPGSSLFDRREPKNRQRKRPVDTETTEEPAASSQPEWVVAGEILETSRLYARTLAKIDPSWIVRLGAHVCRRRYLEPHWDRPAGRVLARERTTLYGLLVQDTLVDFGRVQPREATEIFIRSALMEEDMDRSFPFLQQNRQVRQRIEAWRTQARSTQVLDPDQALFDFYRRRLDNVSSVPDLNRVLQQRGKTDPDFLCAREADLTGGGALTWDEAAFPLEVPLAGHTVSLEYAYAPGEEEDGVTARVPAALAHQVQPAMLDWIVPGLREKQVAFLIKALPKSLRVALMPAAPKAKELAGLLRATDGLDELRRLILERHQVAIPPGAWSREMLPDYLRVRVAITGRDEKPVAAGRDLEKLKQGLEHHETPAEQEAWAQAAAQWERHELESWSFGDLPERIQVAAISATPLCGFPGLLAEEGSVHLKLFRRREEAEQASRAGWQRLAELSLRKELAWLQKDLKALNAIKPLYVTLGPAEELAATAYTHLCRHLLRPPDRVLPLNHQAFDRCLEEARTHLTGVVTPLVERIGSILELRQKIVLCKKPYRSMRADLEVLVQPCFLDQTPYERLAHLPRYLRAMLVRAERAALSPAKDQEKARRVQPYLEALQAYASVPLAAGPAREALATFRWLVEEFKVSVFAQELGTGQSVSPKRLDAALEVVRQESAKGRSG